MEPNTQIKPRYIVTSFRAHSENWKKLKVLATIDGMAIQDKLNEVIVDYLDSNYNKHNVRYNYTHFYTYQRKGT